MRHNILAFLFCCTSFYLFGFQSPAVDSLTNKTFDQLNILLAQSRHDTVKTKLYSSAILSKGRKEKDTNRILTGFYLLSITTKNTSDILKYSDSIISIGKQVQNNRFVGVSYLNKGKLLFAKRKFNLALDNFLQAKKYIDEYPELNFLNEHNIGLLKSRIGDHKEANEIFKSNWRIIKDDLANQDGRNYLLALISVADSYNRIKQFDSATYFNRLGVEKSLQLKDSKRYYQFVLNEGINQYHLKNFDASYDSIAKLTQDGASKLSTPNLIFTYNYYGKNLLKRTMNDSAMVYFKKVDSLFEIINDIHPETRDTYEYLINYYRSKNDLPNQLKYVTQLLKVDSTLNVNNQYLSKRIAKLYDTPKLLKEKESIINSLENKNSLTSSKLYVVLGLLIIVTIALFYFYRRQRILKKRFLDLMQADGKITKKITRPISKESKIPEDVITDILDELDVFEKGTDFLDSKITLNDLSKRFNTNSKYLSKVINTHKNKNFSVYINDLRIEHVVEKIKMDRKFRNYTIKAISSEVGFNTTQAFSKAFHKTTGIYPSYFIRNIEKLEGNQG